MTMTGLRMATPIGSLKGGDTYLVSGVDRPADAGSDGDLCC